MIISKNEIKEILEEAREKKGITKQNLALQIGVTKGTISNYFNNVPSSLINAINFLNALDIDPKKLWINYFDLAIKGEWQTDDKKILELEDEYGRTVAHLLARYNENWSTNDTYVLKLKDQYGRTVAHCLAMHNENWNTNDTKILELEDENGFRVAHDLAQYNKNWTTNDPEILELEDIYDKTVQDILERRRK